MNSRRNFIRQSGLIAASSLLPFPSGAFVPQRKLGVALAGLGYYSTDLLAPALQQTQYCELRGIITGSPEKIPVWQKRYNIPDTNVYNYENMYRIADNGSIDVVYIVLPNGLHAQYSRIAADAGKHVWCEKPMAMNARQCQDIIDACERNKVKLSIGYRMQHEPNTQKIIEWAASKPYGEINDLIAQAGFYNSASDRGHWKLHPELGGGAMYDMGVYPLNAARYATGMEPVAVTARHETTRPEIFDEVDETTIFELEFPGGVTATCKTSFGESINRLEVNCEQGNYWLRPMQSYTGVSGGSSDGKILKPFGGNQQARQMDHDALAILDDKAVRVPGEEGLKDLRVVEAIFESAGKNGVRVKL
ncbi:Gfo/Idh/MocA family protein [Robertkochia aurantiaca]|uniref:Gfo/Idh/MocA family protein n=1 Tax=Robertkochia aurantiaca TaxID=2873700 RepID=UPI001CCC9E29|nr:Gfo/Idh/MocA family oxidoreductase [Robertkochia sp. 3YJGBD-33]